jgi:hypothetical protein
MGFDMQRIDMGIAMCHFQLSCHEMGINGEWAMDPLMKNFQSSEYISSFRLV